MLFNVCIDGFNYVLRTNVVAVVQARQLKSASCGERCNSFVQVRNSIYINKSFTFYCPLNINGRTTHPDQVQELRNMNIFQRV